MAATRPEEIKTKLISVIKETAQINNKVEVYHKLQAAFLEYPFIGTEAADETGKTPLMHAVIEGNLAAMSWLLDPANHPQANPHSNAQDSNGMTAGQHAVAFRDPAGECKDEGILKKRETLHHLYHLQPALFFTFYNHENYGEENRAGAIRRFVRMGQLYSPIVCQHENIYFFEWLSLKQIEHVAVGRVYAAEILDGVYNLAGECFMAFHAVALREAIKHQRDMLVRFFLQNAYRSHSYRELQIDYLLSALVTSDPTTPFYFQSIKTFFGMFGKCGSHLITAVLNHFSYAERKEVVLDFLKQLIESGIAVTTSHIEQAVDLHDPALLNLLLNCQIFQMDPIREELKILIWRNPALAGFFCNQGYPVNEKMPSVNQTPLDYVLKLYKDKQLSVEETHLIVRALLQAKATVELRHFHAAIAEKDPDLIKFFVIYSNFADQIKTDAAILASVIEMGDMPLVNWLVQNDKAKLNQERRFRAPNSPALNKAAERGDFECVILLLERGAACRDETIQFARRHQRVQNYLKAVKSLQDGKWPRFEEVSTALSEADRGHLMVFFNKDEERRARIQGILAKQNPPPAHVKLNLFKQQNPGEVKEGANLKPVEPDKKVSELVLN